jgi:hypothetical protein
VSSTKPGPARADVVRDERDKLKRETRQAVRQWADSIADDERTPTSPQIVVLGQLQPPAQHPYVEPRRSWHESLRPRARQSITATLVAIALAALAAIARALLETH